MRSVEFVRKHPKITGVAIVVGILAAALAHDTSKNDAAPPAPAHATPKRTAVTVSALAHLVHNSLGDDCRKGIYDPERGAQSSTVRGTSGDFIDTPVEPDAAAARLGIVGGKLVARNAASQAALGDANCHVAVVALTSPTRH